MKRCHGQAIVETAIWVALFAGLLAALPMTLMLQDVQRAALRGARDAVQLADWSRGRNSAAEWMAPVARGVDDLQWREPRSGRRVLAPFGETDLHLTNEAPPGYAARMLNFIAAPLRAGDPPGPAFDLTQVGLRSATVTLQVPPLRGAPSPFDTLELALAQRVSSLTDAWNAAGSDHVRLRTSGLVPTARIQPVLAPLNALRGVVSLLEPDLRHLCLGYIAPEEVPRRRIGGAIAAAVPARDVRENCP